MNRIFISYKRVDKDNVFKIKDQIESALGEKCWIDLDGIESDSQFKNVIIKAINECEIILFMYSKAHSKIVDFEKDWTIRELNFASSKNKRIVFVNLDGSPLTDEFVFDYGTKQQIDGQSNDSLKRLVQDLAKWLRVKVVNEEKKVGRQTNEHLHIRYNLDGNWWNRLFLLDVFFVLLWGYFYYHHVWYSSGIIANLSYIINLLPILLRLITTVQLHRNEKTAWIPYIVFFVITVLLWPAGRTFYTFANIIYRPIEYLYLAVNGCIHPSTFSFGEDKIVAGIVMMAIVFLYPVIVYTVKSMQHKLSKTTDSSGIKTVADYLRYDKGLHLAITIMLCVYFSGGIERSYSFPKMLYFLVVNGAMLYFANGNAMLKYSKVWIIACIITITALCLPTIPFISTVTLLYPTIVISKAFKKRGSMFVYYIVCGWLIPYLLYQSIVEDILIRN